MIANRDFNLFPNDPPRGADDMNHYFFGSGAGPPIIELEFEFHRAFKDVLARMMWDIMVKLLSPSPDALGNIIKQIMKTGADQVAEHYRQACPKEDQRQLEYDLGKALDVACKEFYVSHMESVVADGFLEKAQEAIRQNLKKKK